MTDRSREQSFDVVDLDENGNGELRAATSEARPAGITIEGNGLDEAVPFTSENISDTFIKRRRLCGNIPSVLEAATQTNASAFPVVNLTNSSSPRQISRGRAIAPSCFNLDKDDMLDNGCHGSPRTRMQRRSPDASSGAATYPLHMSQPGRSGRLNISTTPFAMSVEQVGKEECRPAPTHSEFASPSREQRISTRTASSRSGIPSPFFRDRFPIMLSSSLTTRQRKTNLRVGRSAVATTTNLIGAESACNRAANAKVFEQAKKVEEDDDDDGDIDDDDEKRDDDESICDAQGEFDGEEENATFTGITAANDRNSNCRAFWSTVMGPSQVQTQTGFARRSSPGATENSDTHRISEAREASELDTADGLENLLRARFERFQPPCEQYAALNTLTGRAAHPESRFERVQQPGQEHAAFNTVTHRASQPESQYFSEGLGGRVGRAERVRQVHLRHYVRWRGTELLRHHSILLEAAPGLRVGDQGESTGISPLHRHTGSGVAAGEVGGRHVLHAHEFPFQDRTTFRQFGLALHTSNLRGYNEDVSDDAPLELEVDDRNHDQSMAASRSIIHNLPVTVATAADTNISCCICMCDVEAGEELRTLPCVAKHRYHKECIERWLETNGCCPVDKIRVDGKPSD